MQRLVLHSDATCTTTWTLFLRRDANGLHLIGYSACNHTADELAGLLAQPKFRAVVNWYNVTWHLRPPLYEAAWWNEATKIRLLCYAGACPDIRESSGLETPLHSAVTKHNLEAVEACLQCGADPDAPNGVRLLARYGSNKGVIPLVHALSHNHLPTAMLLVAFDADIFHHDVGSRLAALGCPFPQFPTPCTGSDGDDGDEYSRAYRRWLASDSDGPEVSDAGGRAKESDVAAGDAAGAEPQSSVMAKWSAVEHIYFRFVAEADEAAMERCRRLGLEKHRPRGMQLLRFRRAVEAKRDAGRVFRAASEGRPMELARRLRLGKLAGGLAIKGMVDGDLMLPQKAARLGGHDECVKLLNQAAFGLMAQVGEDSSSEGVGDSTMAGQVDALVFPRGLQGGK